MTREARRRLLQALKTARVSQRALADTLDVSPALVNHLVAGRRGHQPSAKALRVMYHLCTFVGCSYQELWGQ